MRVNRRHQFVHRRLQPHRQRRFADDLGRPRPDHMHAENLAVFCPSQNFYEAAFAFVGAEDAAFPGTLGDQRQRIVGVLHQRQHADEARGPLGVIDIAQFVQQFVDVGGVVAMRAGVTRRVQAGRAIERVDAYAGIIRQGRIARGSRGGERLDRRVFLEGRAGFGGLRQAELAGRGELDPIPGD